MSTFRIEKIHSVSVDLLRLNPDRVYVFEDTLDQSGVLGQWAVRDQPNACGIPTRRCAGLTSYSVFTDQEHEFDAVTKALRQLYREGRDRTLVFPQGGIGHGTYGLVHHSPRLYRHLCTILKDHFGFRQPPVHRGSPTRTDACNAAHRQLFNMVCTRGGVGMAHAIAEEHGILLEELKKHCLKAGQELAEEGLLFPLLLPIYRWAKEQ